MSKPSSSNEPTPIVHPVVDRVVDVGEVVRVEDDALHVELAVADAQRVAVAVSHAGGRLGELRAASFEGTEHALVARTDEHAHRIGLEPVDREERRCLRRDRCRRTGTPPLPSTIHVPTVLTSPVAHTCAVSVALLLWQPAPAFDDEQRRGIAVGASPAVNVISVIRSHDEPNR